MRPELLAAATDAVTRTSTAEAVVFWVLGAVAVLGAIGVVAAPKAVYSAVFLASTMIALAVLYVAQDALFLGVVQVVVYTGAVMMLFLFVVMIIGVDSSESLTETLRGQRIAAILASVAFGILLIASTGNVSSHSSQEVAKMYDEDNVQGLAALIFTRYLWAFELTSALLITAATGTMVLTYRQRAQRRKTQRELATDRFREGRYPTTLPNPGVYARHNAVDVPALLPDGSPSRLSVPPVLRPRIGAARRASSSPQPHLRLVAPAPSANWVDEWEEG
ncbi:NADH-quinone oxidoreductase subunit J [Mycolicibacterium brisbanense]|uniref:NADH-quinone oxidoreductase subunit J n=1 Tax=Mycolicibacterium brisbanense TaxID=146020 RepID=A0A100W2Y3_9MYCO|nr:NADH-quinone oxidoreductase subunit J [Mycolicibacterium brisbanense]MCV7156527.1 NADH-quinone oxidoreductase subunit J [Mycolicibacterium brisbanense]GAS90653.1 NADH dehydrogenase subunit J [Mycolicibacterium brisbanense]